METKDIGEPSLWIPITDKVLLAALGKLGEEANELGAIICRSIIQGLDGVNPKDGVVNLAALQNEIADVAGLSMLVSDMLNLNRGYMVDRAERKFVMKDKWMEMLRELEK